MDKLFFLLGADDPEMREIVRVLMINGHQFDFALAKSGDRVTPGEAYYCQTPVMSTGAKLVCVECKPLGYLDGDYVKIDHHCPGDPGYSLDATHYWEASSIGQVCTLISVSATPELRVVAAMDHCFAKALRGQCPGIKPWDVCDYYISTIAENRNVELVDVRSQVVSRAARMGDESSIRIAKQDVTDCRGWSVGEGYSIEYLASIAAASISGRAILLSSVDTAGRKKVVLCGYVDPETVTAFQEIASADFHLSNVYGVPIRGYAGGYLS